MATGLKVIIIGGGLGGPLLANGLVREGIEVALYERLPSDANRAGYQIRVAAPCFMGLQACLSSKYIVEVAKSLGGYVDEKTTAPTLYDRNFKPLFSFGSRSDYDGSAPIDRVVLRNIILSGLPENVLHSGKQFVKYEILKSGGTERVRAWFADGSWDEGDILIGADGSHSKVNEAVGLRNLETITSHWQFITKSPIPLKVVRSLPLEAQTAPVMSMTDGCVFFFVVYMPHDDDDEDRLVSATCALGIPADRIPRKISELTRDGRWELCQDVVSAWHPKFGEIFEVVRSTADMHAYQPSVAKKPPSSWRKQAAAESAEKGHPRVWLFGDALHAMLPNRGMGGNQAMRDTVVILEQMKELHEIIKTNGSCNTEQVASRCAKAESEIIPRAFRWVEESGGSNMAPLDTTHTKDRIIFFFMKSWFSVMKVWVFLTSFLPDQDSPERRAARQLAQIQSRL